MSGVSPDDDSADLKIDAATNVPKQNGSIGPDATSGDLENGNSDDDEADDDAHANGTAEGAAKKKKKRKPRKKKKASPAKGQTGPPTV